MKIIPILIFLADLVVNFWLVVIISRNRIWKHLPWFALYIAQELATTAVGLALWLVDQRLYVTFFWWTEALRIVLIVGLVRESFVRIFLGFSSLRWFPWVVRSVIGCVLVYSMWKAIYAPPIQNNKIISLIIAGEFTFRWGIAAVGLLSLLMVWFFQLPNDTRETAVILGSAVASAAFLANVVSRSLFGTKYALITQFIPDVGYLVATLIWIKYMSRPEPEFGFEELSITPEMMVLELHRYRQAAERLFGKSKEN
jgi:hypothetical protein